VQHSLGLHVPLCFTDLIAKCESDPTFPGASATASASATTANATPRRYYALVDGNRLPPALVTPSSTLPLLSGAEALVRGDGREYAIAAASIVAKVTRDRLMMAAHKLYPDYGFDEHKGYGVPAHMRAIHKFGPCAIHRQTFAPMKHMKQKAEAADEEAEPQQPKAASSSTAAASGKRRSPAARAAPAAAAAEPKEAASDAKKPRARSKIKAKAK
jgi:ribonuclease HII